MSYSTFISSFRNIKGFYLVSILVSYLRSRNINKRKTISLLLVSLFSCFIMYLSIYLASDRVSGDRREDRAFFLLLSAGPIICGLLKQKIKDKGRERERGRTNDPTRKQIIIIVLITHTHSDWVVKNSRNATDLPKWLDCESRTSSSIYSSFFFC